MHFWGPQNQYLAFFNVTDNERSSIRSQVFFSLVNTSAQLNSWAVDRMVTLTMWEHKEGRQTISTQFLRARSPVDHLGYVSFVPLIIHGSTISCCTAPREYDSRVISNR